MNSRKIKLNYLFLIVTIYIGSFDVKLAIGGENLPIITIEHAALFDEVCSKRYSYPIDKKWEEELNSRLPLWKKLWNQDGILLLKTATEIVGKHFEDKSFRVALSVCSFPSISFPLIVNVRYTLKSFTENPVSDIVFISRIEHELLHNYLDRFMPNSTPLLTKYRTESKGVQSHLHLFALQKATYIKLDWEGKLKEVIAADESLPNKEYKRAWEIINKLENYSSFVDELKLTTKGY